MKLGFIGLGIMGMPMARNLLKAGFQVVIWNRTTEKCAELAALGASVAATPRQVMEGCDITFAMLADPAAAEEVCFGSDGVAAGVTPGKGYIDMSTVSPETSQKIASAVKAKGGLFLEAPVSGSRKPAEDGTLVILAAGDQELYDRSQPVLQNLGKKLFYLGAVGQGAQMKLIINMIMGGMMTLLGEGVALGSRSGFKAEELLDVLDSGALANPMFKLKGSMIAKGDFSVAFPLKHMQKDLRLALDLGGRRGLSLYTVAAANESFKAALGAGYGDEDFSAVSKIVVR